MSVTLWFALVGWMFVLIYLGWSISRERSIRRCADYARAAAVHYWDHGDLARSSAYSDMATVIALDGKAPPRWQQEPGA